MDNNVLYIFNPDLLSPIFWNLRLCPCRWPPSALGAVGRRRGSLPDHQAAAAAVAPSVRVRRRDLMAIYRRPCAGGRRSSSAAIGGAAGRCERRRTVGLGDKLTCQWPRYGGFFRSHADRAGSPGRLGELWHNYSSSVR